MLVATGSITGKSIGTDHGYGTNRSSDTPSYCLSLVFEEGLD